VKEIINRRDASKQRMFERFCNKLKSDDRSR